MKKIILLFILLVNFLSAEFNFDDMFKDMKDAATSMSQDAKDSVTSMKNGAVETSKSTDRIVIVDDNLKTTELHSESELKQRSLQLKKIKSQIWILHKEIDNLVNENHLITSKIDIKIKKRVSIQQQAGYDIDTYLEQIQSLQKKEIMDNVSFSDKIEQYKQKARDVKRKTLNEVTRIEQKLENLKSELKLNQKKLTRYQINQDEKEKLLNYYNSTK